MLTVDGLVTGIDTESIIKGLLEIQQQQIDRIGARKTTAQQRQAALQSLEAQVLSLRTQAGRIGRVQDSPFHARSVAVSHEDALIATANAGAAAGIYDVRVNTLARSHQVATQGFADRESQITTGTVAVRVGSSPATTITIDSSNNTLQGLAEAINNSDAGVSASIIQDGTTGTPYRLLLTAQSSGTANAITLTNNLAASGGGAVQPAFDLNNPVQAATNASVTLGSGIGAITVESATNEVDGLIDGVTLNLLQADPSQSLTVRVNADTEAATKAVQDFVDSFNNVLEFIDSQTGYNAETGVAGLLQGDRAVIDIEQELRAAVLDVVPGVTSRLNRLTAIGISVRDDGGLSFNASELTDILEGRVEGVTAQDVERLFSLNGGSTHPGISFLLGSTRTVARTDPYQVDITQAAERAAITAGSALAASTVIDGTNDAFTLRVDGAEFGLTLAHGTFTAQSLADLIESTFNAHPDAGGRELAASLGVGGELTLTSARYGSTSEVTASGGTLLPALGFATGQADVGVDVVGSFIVDGQTETATGRGRVLSGASDNAHTADLQVRVSLTAGQIVAGAEGDLTITRGIGSRLDQLLGRMLDADGGALTAAQERFDDTIESLQDSIDRQQGIFDRQQERLAAQFQAMESAISQLQSNGSLLSAQLASLQTLRVGGQR
jgi:flagellar hook-associated protein 2